MAQDNTKSQDELSGKIQHQDEKTQKRNQKILSAVQLGRIFQRMYYPCLVLLWPTYVNLHRPEVSVFAISAVISAQQFANIIASLISGLVIQKIGHKRAFMTGSFLINMTQLSFLLCQLISDDNWFIGMCFLSRFCQGFPSAFISTSSTTMITYTFQRNREENLAKLQVAEGIGFMLGILMILVFSTFTEFYTINGIIVGLYLISLIYMNSAIPNKYNFLKNDKLENFSKLEDLLETDEDHKEVTYWMFFTNKMSCLAIVQGIITATVPNSYIAIYPIELTKLGVAQTWISLIFFTSFIAGFLAVISVKKRIQQLRPYRMRIATGVFHVISQIIYTKGNLTAISIGQIVMSIGAGFTAIAILPDILAGTEKQLRQKNTAKGLQDRPIPIQLQDRASALMQLVIMIPPAIGNMYGGALYDAKGFSKMALINSLISLSALVILVFMIYGYKPELNIQDYETLDGTRPVKQFKDNDSTLINNSTDNKKFQYDSSLFKDEQDKYASENEALIQK